MNLLGKLFPYIFIFILSFFAFRPFLNQGFFPIHDNTQVARVYEMTKALKDGEFPVRWVQDLGYGFGYPIFNFYDPFPYYVGGFIGLLGLDALFSTKLMMVLGIVLAAYSMYILAKEFWGDLGGIFASILYVYAPYHALDIYVRGDVAEFWAYSFMPLLFYGFWKLYKEEKWRYVIVSSLSFSLIIVSHNISALMLFPFAVLFAVYLFLLNPKRKLLFLLISAFILGFLISAFYWFPAILEMKYTNVLSLIGGGSNFRDHFVCLFQLWTSPWGFGGSAKGCVDGLSFMIGKYHIIFSLSLFLLSMFILISNKHQKLFVKDKEKLKIIILSFAGLLISVFFTLEVSRPVWELIGPMAFIQYPWRFLLFIVFFASFISGSFFFFVDKIIDKRKIQYLLAVILFLFMIFVSLKFFVPQTFLSKSSSDYTNNFALKWTTSKISDEYMPKNFRRPKQALQIADMQKINSDNVRITGFSQKTQELNMTITVQNAVTQIFPIAYFPAWKGYLDGNKLNLYENIDGMSANLLQGNHNLRIIFVQTPIEMIGDVISIAGILLLIAGIIHLRTKYE